MTRLTLMAAYVATLAIAIAGRHLVMANADVSWLLTVAEKMLDGGRLYVDMLETNPPMAVYLYTPAVALGRVLSIRPEIALDAMVLTLGFLCIVWSGARLPKDIGGPARPFLGPIAFAVVAVMPAFTFGEREHIALILFLPWLAIAIRRASDLSVRWYEIALAGIAGGLVMMIKPHFALALGFATLAAAIWTRDWRRIFVAENVIAGALLAAYLAIAIALYPAYWNTLLPTLRLVYLPVRIPVWRMLFGAFPIFALEMIAIGFFVVWSRGKALLTPWAVIGAAAAAGFLVAAILQGKGWTYHFLPALGLIVLLLAALAVWRPATGKPDALLAVFAIAFFAQVWNWGTIGLDMSPLRARMAEMKPGPRLVSLASDLSVGFPLVRDVGGVWVDRSFARWIPYYAGGMAASDGFDPSRLPDLRAAVETDRRGLAQDIRDNRPDALLIERRPFDFLEWARRDGELAGLLKCFGSTSKTIVGDPGKVGGEGIEVEIWSRQAATIASASCEGVAISR